MKKYSYHRLHTPVGNSDEGNDAGGHGRSRDLVEGDD